MTTEKADTEELIRLAREGDLEAWGSLLQGQQPFLLARAEQQMSSTLSVRVEPADVVQQTFLEAHRSLAQLQGTSAAAFRAWLETILDNTVSRTIRNHMLLQKRDVRREQSLDDSGGGAPLGPELDAGCTTPSQRAIRNEEETRLRKALATLPPDQATAVRMRKLENRSLDEIAEALGKTRVAAASLLKRGTQALQRKLSRPD